MLAEKLIFLAMEFEVGSFDCNGWPIRRGSAEEWLEYTSTFTIHQRSQDHGHEARCGHSAHTTMELESIEPASIEREHICIHSRNGRLHGRGSGHRLHLLMPMPPTPA